MPHPATSSTHLSSSTLPSISECKELRLMRKALPSETQLGFGTPRPRRGHSERLRPPRVPATSSALLRPHAAGGPGVTVRRAFRSGGLRRTASPQARPSGGSAGHGGRSLRETSAPRLLKQHAARALDGGRCVGGRRSGRITGAVGVVQAESPH